MMPTAEGAAMKIAIFPLHAFTAVIAAQSHQEILAYLFIQSASTRRS